MNDRKTNQRQMYSYHFNRQNSYNSRRRSYDTEPIQASSLGVKPKKNKIVESSVFLPSIHKKTIPKSPLSSNKYLRHQSVHDIETQSEDDTFECLEQCQRILSNLRRLTSASYKKEMRKNKKSYSVFQNQFDLGDYGKRENHYERSPKPEHEILHISIPETSYKPQPQKSRASQRFFNQDSIKNQAKTQKMPTYTKQKYEAKSPVNQKKHNISNSRKSMRESDQEKNQMIDLEGKEEEQINQFNEGKIDDREQEKSEFQKDDHYNNQNKKEQQNQGVQGENINGDEEKQAKDQQAKQHKLNKQSQLNSLKSDKIAKQKNLLKYLMKAKNRGSILNQKVGSFINKRNSPLTQNSQKYKVNNKDQLRKAKEQSIKQQSPRQVIKDIDGETGLIVDNADQYRKQRALKMERFLEEQS